MLQLEVDGGLTRRACLWLEGHGDERNLVAVPVHLEAADIGDVALDAAVRHRLRREVDDGALAVGKAENEEILILLSRFRVKDSVHTGRHIDLELALVVGKRELGVDHVVGGDLNPPCHGDLLLAVRERLGNLRRDVGGRVDGQDLRACLRGDNWSLCRLGHGLRRLGGRLLRRGLRRFYGRRLRLGGRNDGRGLRLGRRRLRGGCSRVRDVDPPRRAALGELVPSAEVERQGQPDVVLLGNGRKGDVGRAVVERGIRLVEPDLCRAVIAPVHHPAAVGGKLDLIGPVRPDAVADKAVHALRGLLHLVCLGVKPPADVVQEAVLARTDGDELFDRILRLGNALARSRDRLG